MKRFLQNFHVFLRKAIGPILAFFLYQNGLGQATYTSTGNGNWSAPATWSISGVDGNGDGIPDADDDVFIGTDDIVTVDVNSAANSVTLGSGLSFRTLTLNADLSVTGNVILAPGNGDINTILVGSFNLTVGGSITVAGNVTPNRNAILNIGSGSVAVSSNVTISNNNLSQLIFSGSGSLIIGGVFTAGASSTITVGTGTFEYNGAAQTIHGINYYNLILSGSGPKTLSTSTTSIGQDLTISGSASAATVVGLTVIRNLFIDDGATFTAAGFDFSAGGTTTIGGGTSGSLELSSTSGTKTFTGLVTINAGGTWNNSSNEDVTFRSGITNNGTFTAGSGIQTFDTNPQSLTGTFIIPNVTVTGVTLTNNNSLTVNTDLTGTGGLTQANNATLNIGGTSGITTLTATNSGNTVNYTGAAQTVNNNNFVNLGLSGSGSKTLQAGTTTISGNLTFSGTADATAVTGLTIGGNLTLGAGTTFVGGAFTHNLAGNWSNNGGTFTNAGSTINFNGTAQTIGGSSSTTFNNVTISGSSSTTTAVATTIAGNLSVGDGTTFTDGGFDLSIGGTTTIGGGTSGSLESSSTSGTKTFTGLVTINAGGTWNNSSNEDVTFRGGITNNGTFTAGSGIQTFDTNPQSLTGTFNIPNVTVTGIALTNNNALTVDTDLSGTGGLTQANNATLNIGGTSGITTLTATNSGNTVNYTGAAQTVNNNNFVNLGLSGSSSKTLQAGTTTISGNLTFGGTADATAVTGLTIGGNLTLGAGTTFVGGAFTHNLAGDWTNNGATFTNAGSTINFNGTAQTIGGSSNTTFNNVTISGSSSTTTAVATTIVGNLSIGDGTSFSIESDLTVAGTTTVGGGISGSLNFSTNTGVKIFTGLVTINSGATWNNTANESIQFQGGITNNGSFNSGTATHTFNSNNQTLTGTFTIQQLTVTGVVLSNTNTLTVSNSLSGSGILNQKASSTLNISGTSTISQILATAAGNLVNYNAAGAQTIADGDYYHLNLSGSGVKTFQSGTSTILGNLTLSGTVISTTAAALSILGNLSVGDGTTLTIAGFDFSAGGTTTIGGGTSGSLELSSTSGTKTFTGLVTINAGGTWNNSSNEAVTFRGGITNNGTFTAGSGIQTFDTNPQSLTGTFIIPNVTVTGVTLTNNNSLTVNTDLTGTGGLTQANNATLNIGGTSGITTLTATNSGNTVNYTGAAQTVNNNNFVNLGLSGSGSKTLQAGTTTISGNLTFGGTADATAVTGLTIGGNLTLGAGTTFVGGAFTHNLAGDWTNNGATFTNAGSTINFNGTAQTIGGSSSTTFNNVTISGSSSTTTAVATTIAGSLSVGDGTTFTDGGFDLSIGGTTTIGGGTSGSLVLSSTLGTKTFTGLVTINAGGTWNNSSNEDVTFRGGITNNGTFTAGSGIQTFDTNPQSLTGTFNIPNVTVTGIALTNNNALTVDTDLSGTGGLTQANNATLNIGGTSGITTLTATNSGNTVNYTGAAQTVNNNNFVNLGLSGSSSKTLQAGTTTISGNLTFGGTADATAVTGLTIGGNLTLGAGTTFVGGAFTHNLAGDWTNNGATFTNAGSTINFNGTAQTIGGSSNTTFNNVNTSGSTSTVTAVGTTIASDLIIGDGTTFTVAGFDFSVGGTTIVGGGISGNLVLSFSTGTKVFTGLILVNTGAVWNNTSNEAVTFRGSLLNNGTFNAGNGIHTFDTNPQFLAGTFIIPNVNVVGIALTNNNVLTVSASLSGSGSLMQATDAILNLGGTYTITTIDVSNSDNTVNYSGSNQTILPLTYENLEISQSSGEASLSGNVVVNKELTLNSGNLNLSGFDCSVAISPINGSFSASRMIIASGGSQLIHPFPGGGLFLFPIGDNTGILQYSPIEVGVSGATSIGVSVVDGKHP